jgi:type III restriction enzyme
MQLQLEDLLYQNKAIQSAVELFKGQSKNVSERTLLSQSNANANAIDITPNQCLLSPEQLHKNKISILQQSALAENEAALSEEPQICIEMETGTGKTLVYIRTLYELYREYGYTKFIILVPSIAVKEGIINTLESFAEQLKDYYQHNIHWFEYDSNRLNQLKHFINDDQPQIMLTTVQAFTAEDRILNQTGRDDSIGGFSYLEALGQTRPIIIMDEPQEGMDTELAQKRLTTLTPLFVFRYSATHKRIINRLYRLTPYDAYAEGLVKKIEVLSVAEINDEATLKIELQEIQTQAGQDPKAKLNLWHNIKAGFTLKPSKWLKVGDNLGAITNNISYQDFTVERIYKGLRDKNWKIHFSNGVEIEQNLRQGDIGGIFRQQLYWLINSHFDKQQKLTPLGIKCLSLIFIDKVDNYIDSEPLIKNCLPKNISAFIRSAPANSPVPHKLCSCRATTLRVPVKANLPITKAPCSKTGKSTTLFSKTSSNCCHWRIRLNSSFRIPRWVSAGITPIFSTSPCLIRPTAKLKNARRSAGACVSALTSKASAFMTRPATIPMMKSMC